VLPASNTTFPLPGDQTEILIGREDAISGAFPQVNLEPYGAQDAGVSRRHARIRILSGDWWIEDLNSVNGTFLNRQRLNPDQPMPLNHGDEVRLGKLALIFYRD
jgi:pSer/pThr/pTyr-binding forkhead associated (FHA) protein